MLTQNLGFPRIGTNRELKKACESYWKGNTSIEDLELAGKNERKKNWQFQKKSGIDLIPSNDFSFYDQVADLALMFGVTPRRFDPLIGKLSKRDFYFSLCRGYQDKNLNIAPLEMTKWFDTNYHYLVPEFEKDQHFKVNDTKIIDEFDEALELGIKTKPVLIGPISFLKLGKEKENNFDRLKLIHSLLPIYIELIGKLENAGAECIQIDEPYLVTDLSDYEKQLYRVVYTELFGSFPSIKFVLATYFGEITQNLSVIKEIPLEVLHIDFVRGKKQLENLIGNIPDKLTLSLGIVDGRNIWKNELEESLEIILKVQKSIGSNRVIIAPSCSLLHVPYDVSTEKESPGLPIEVKNRLAFAKQKIEEITTLANLCSKNPDKEAQQTLAKSISEIKNWQESSLRNNDEVQREQCKLPLEIDKIKRNLPFNERVKLQQEKLKLNELPTTMIGSLPQTNEVRAMRQKYKQGNVSQNEYDTFIKQEIAKAITWQEEAGIDVLVHGEFERNDMVEFFGEKLNGYAFTQNGWVQSYGSRGVKPPIIFGDVSRKTPMTVETSVYAQSLTRKNVKGMLTGPVTMLQWSFVRDDQPRKKTTEQLALAINKEVLDLERAGINIIQIDEPALREGLPLRKRDCPEYLNWAIKSFRISYQGVKDETQIHTHMCYAEFNDILSAIAAMDADVISIEASRSQMELLNVFAKTHYLNHIGPGIYDIHSPRIPSSEEICDLLYAASRYIKTENLWVNPDCGLKTRSWEEVKPSIKNMVDATVKLRNSITISA